MNRELIHLNPKMVHVNHEKDHVNRGVIHMTGKTNRAVTHMNCAMIHMNHAPAPEGESDSCRVYRNFTSQTTYYTLMNKLNTGFSRLSDNDFDNKAQAIVAALTGNANFPTTTPTLANITTAINAYQDALAMSPGQPRDVAVAATRATLSTQLEQLARGLELVTNVTDTMLATSGFDL